MKEQIVTFETAKLAKEKGFNWFGKSYTHKGIFQDREILSDYNNWYSNTKDNYLITAPTQSLLQKWLRDVKNIFISVDVNYCYKIYKDDEYFTESNDYNSYEEALEVGLQEALILIQILK